MTARTVVQNITGAILSISANVPSAFTTTLYKTSTVVFTEIGQVETVGNHGVTANVATFTPVKTARVTKIKGSKDYGTMNLMIGSIPSNSGQAILRAAAESTAHYSAKLEYPDGEVHYLDVLVSKFEYQDGDANAISKVAVDLALCEAPTIDPAP